MTIQQATEKTPRKLEPSDQNLKELAPKKRGLMKTREGIVVSDKMKKTVVVAIATKRMHGAYGKYIKRTKRYVAHDESGACGMGDRVLIVESRPLSKTKRWRVQSIVEKAV